MAEHSASVTVRAPVHQVYTLFTHFNDFPKFMRFVKEVTYYDEQRSHWVVHVLRDYEWDAVNEDWIPDRQIGWRSTSGLRNTGKVKFHALGPDRTEVGVYISYTPPTGALGALGEHLGAGSYLDTIMQEDLTHFAQMVEQAPEGALDPMSSHYLFHPKSATTLKITTPRQNKAMANDPNMSPEALSERQARIAREEAERKATIQARELAERQRREQEQRLQEEQQALLERENARRLEEQRLQQIELARQMLKKQPPDPVLDTLGGRNAAKERTAFGDRDGLRPRHPRYEQSPMMARYPLKNPTTIQVTEEEEVVPRESPWLHSIRGLSPQEQQSPPE